MNDSAGIACPVATLAHLAPDRIALRTSAGDISYAAWHQKVTQAEARLLTSGVGPGTRVGLCMPNGVDLLSLLIAIFRAGAVACPVNPAFPDAYRDELLARLACAVRMGKKEGAEEVAPPSPPQYERPHLPTWPLNQPATIIFTSGSTGTPKAAVLSLRNHVGSARASNANIPLGPEDCWLFSLPLYHVAGFGVLFRCLEAGAIIGIPEAGAPLHGSIAQTKATHVSLVARQLAQLLVAPPLPRPLKAILLGGSAIPAALLDRAVAAGLPVHTSYGMTETASQITATPPGAARKVLASSGRPLSPNTLRIGDKGTIEVNGAARFLGYWEAGTIVQPFDKDGWFTTSDCGHIDGSGYLHITGRRDNVFIAGGENIQPEEIERALCALPGISQAVVVPLPHAEFGATPVAFVQCDGTPDADAIRAALLAVLPAFKVPRHYLTWPTDLAGEMKVDRRQLAARAEATGLAP